MYRSALLLVTAGCFAMGVVLVGAYPNPRSDDYPDYQLGVKYDEYPMIVPKKRTALLVNRLMVALKEAMQNEERQEALKNNNDNLDRLPTGSNKNYALSPDDIRSMDLQRRGHGNMSQQKGRIYWRCYFNAVTCF